MLLTPSRMRTALSMFRLERSTFAVAAFMVCICITPVPTIAAMIIIIRPKLSHRRVLIFRLAKFMTLTPLLCEQLDLIRQAARPCAFLDGAILEVDGYPAATGRRGLCYG